MTPESCGSTPQPTVQENPSSRPARWCPTCERNVGTSTYLDAYVDENTERVCHTTCGTALAQHPAVVEIRVHSTEGWIAIHDRPGTSRPWAKVVPGISLTSQDVAGWEQYAPISWNCCRWHGPNCEPREELCCDACAEQTHPDHADGSRCVLPLGEPPA